MPAVEPIVNEEKLNECLNEGHESAQLDYKRTCDLSSRDAVVELTKDIGAMMIDGGYIVVGADDNGNVVPDLTVGQAAMFDEATLRAKVARYLPAAFEVRSCVLKKDGHNVALVHVEPHPQGFCIFAQDGDRHNRNPAFRKGEVFARHGTASERWQQPDIDRVLARRIRTAKDEWERDVLGPLLDRITAGEGAQQLARGPVEALTWRLDLDTFRAAVIEQMRSGDDIPLTLLLNDLPRVFDKLVASKNFDDLGRMLDRVAMLAMLGVEISRPQLVDLALGALHSMYESQIGRHEEDAARGVESVRAWIAIALRAYGIGAYAVRRRDWKTVYDVATWWSARFDDDPYTVSWLRHTVTMGSRANLLMVEEGGQQRKQSIIAFARQLIDEQEYLRPDVSPGDDAVLDSLCQFDFLSAVASIGKAAKLDSGVFYTSFAMYRDYRTVPAAVLLVTNRDARAILFPGHADDALANALLYIHRYAQNEGFRYAGWDEYRNDTVDRFIQQNETLSAASQA